MKDVKQDDTVYIPSIEMFANEETEFKTKTRKQLNNM